MLLLGVSELLVSEGVGVGGGDTELILLSWSDEEDGVGGLEELLLEVELDLLLVDLESLAIFGGGGGEDGAESLLFE